MATVFSTILGRVNGYITYPATAGLFGLAVDETLLRHNEQAAPSILAAMSTAGLRHAVSKSVTDPSKGKGRVTCLTN